MQSHGNISRLQVVTLCYNGVASLLWLVTIQTTFFHLIMNNFSDCFASDFNQYDQYCRCIYFCLCSTL